MENEVIDEVETPELDSEETVPTVDHPELIVRLKASIADGLVLVALMILMANIFETDAGKNEALRMWAFIFIFGLYDPLFTSFLGGTIGHYMMGIRVKRVEDQSKNVILPMTMIRYVVKVFLGLISVLTVSGHPESRALHDRASNSIVIFKKNKGRQS